MAVIVVPPTLASRLSWCHRATPLLARRTADARSLDELLFAFIILADDRAVVDTVIE